MTIHFIPNDPGAKQGPAMGSKKPRADRPANRAGFIYEKVAKEAEYAPGTPEFLYWQCREGAMAALETWEKLGEKQTRWVKNKKKLQLRQNAGEDLNAYYDRSSLSFFEKTLGKSRATQNTAYAEYNLGLSSAIVALVNA